MVETRQKAKKQGIATNSKTTSPSKAVSRKVSNVINFVASQEVMSKMKSNQNNDKTASSLTRLCSVKLRNCRDSCGNNKNALQAQCKVNKTESLNKKSENKVRVTDKFQTNDNVVRIAKTNKRKVDDLNNNDLQDKNSVKKTSLTTMKPSNKTRAKRAENDSKIKEKSERQKPCEFNLKSRIKTKPKGQYQPNFMLPSTLKRCTVKLQKMKTLQQQDYLSPDTSNCSGKTSLASKTTSIPFEVPSTPCCKRKCVVKVQKNPGLLKANGTFIEPSTRLKKSAISNRNENGEHTDYAATKLPTSTPVIDDTKRKNFCKLSLTKSSTKLSETLPRENETNSNHKNCNEHETKETHNNNKDIEVLRRSVESNDVKQLHSKKTKINDLKTIKHIPKLSLKKTNVNRNQNITGKDITRFEPQQNSTLCFEPLRNSTVLEFDLNKKQSQEKPNEESQKPTPTKDKSSSKNLANKSDEIENLLNSLDDDDCIIIENNQNRNKKTNKFFHHQKVDVMENVLKEQNTKSPTIQVVRKKRRLYVRRSTIAKRDNIYEFYSQSQTSDSDNAKHVDPTADIIKKLIDQGKVRVATNCRGKGKPKFKRKKPTKQIKKGKQTDNKNLKTFKNNAKKVTFKDKNNDDAYEDNHFNDHFENDVLDSDHDFDMLNQNQDVVSNSLKIHNNKTLANDQEGTFSRLAKKVLINQAGRSDQQRKNASALLGMVKKIVSTPKNKKTALPEMSLVSDLSPIPKQHPRPSAMASPWRVSEDEYFPKTFNFSRSSGNLPSFSCDIIPSTPRKMKAKDNPKESYHHAIMGEKSQTKCNQNLLSNKPTLPTNNAQHPRTPNVSEPSVISSFSSNDSNAENVPPPRCTTENYSENDNIFDLKQLPNPRRNLNNRSPLKTINILEVVHLPPLNSLNKKANTKQTSRDQTEQFPFEKDPTVPEISAVNVVQQKRFSPKIDNLPIENLFGFAEFFPQTELSIQESIEVNNSDAVTSKHNQTLHDKLKDLRNLEASAVLPNKSSETTKTTVKEDLFGFEEFLPQSGFSSQESIETNNNETALNNQNHTIHEKLQDLRKLKPNENELHKELLEKNTINPIKRTPLFNDDSLNEDAMRQRGIKEMLCSTTLNLQPSTSKEALRMLNNRNFKDPQQPKSGEDLDLTGLFKDPDPETTFNENEAHRTYIRPYKRKRRLRENKHVFIVDSDVSEDEDEDNAHKHLSRESNNSPELAPKKKRNRKGLKERKEDLAFIEEFNQMVKEVDSYELIVEKST